MQDGYSLVHLQKRHGYEIISHEQHIERSARDIVQAKEKKKNTFPRIRIRHRLFAGSYVYSFLNLFREHEA